MTVWLDDAVVGLKQFHVVGSIHLGWKRVGEGWRIEVAVCEVVGWTGEDGCDTGFGHGRHNVQ